MSASPSANQYVRIASVNGICRTVFGLADRPSFLGHVGARQLKSWKSQQFKHLDSAPPSSALK
jgi:hypothetical protein